MGIPTIDLHGCTKHEAHKIIDQVAYQGIDLIRVITGHGTGALKALIKQLAPVYHYKILKEEQNGAVYVLDFDTTAKVVSYYLPLEDYKRYTFRLINPDGTYYLLKYAGNSGEQLVFKNLTTDKNIRVSQKKFQDGLDLGTIRVSAAFESKKVFDSYEEFKEWWEAAKSSGYKLMTAVEIWVKDSKFSSPYDVLESFEPSDTSV